MSKKNFSYYSKTVSRFKFYLFFYLSQSIYEVEYLYTIRLIILLIRLSAFIKYLIIEPHIEL